MYPGISPEECRVTPSRLYSTSGGGKCIWKLKPLAGACVYHGEIFWGRRLTGENDRLFVLAAGQRVNVSRQPLFFCSNSRNSWVHEHLHHKERGKNVHLWIIGRSLFCRCSSSQNYEHKCQSLNSHPACGFNSLHKLQSIEHSSHVFLNSKKVMLICVSPITTTNVGDLTVVALFQSCYLFHSPLILLCLLWKCVPIR